ncbi:hypothetical protein Daud_0966 [Candidatus Desulforudis audaxviator MP104C]|uniref:Uncharacterized protein n=1 Tax=Desulforudis audaxviator (strain MP104C) TaxID=477974 RepID=B1I3F6_DESAP|nr:hypothetical protein Daud_0966 [Candidatus Desulforudis audaxviator MP104C]
MFRCPLTRRGKERELGVAESNPEVNVERTSRTEFFKRHLRVIAALGIAFVVISAGTVTYVILKPDAGNVPADQAPPGTGPDKAGQAYEVLPKTKRPLDPVPEETPKRKQVKDPFIGPLELAGVILGGRGGNLAIIEAGDAAYVVSEGDLVQSVWTVSKIDKDTVLLTAGEQELELSLAGRR